MVAPNTHEILCELCGRLKTRTQGCVIIIDPLVKLICDECQGRKDERQEEVEAQVPKGV